MNYKKKAKELFTKMKALLENAKAEERAFTAEEKKSFDAYKVEHDSLMEMAALDSSFPQDKATPVAPTILSDVKITKEEPIFKSLGEQLKAVRSFAREGIVDERLIKVNAAMGGNEGNGPDGGFAVESDKAPSLMESMIEESPIVNATDKYNISSKSDRVGWLEAKENSSEEGVFGGLKMYWAAEAATVAATKPTIVEREIKLYKLMGFTYDTNELEMDSNFYEQMITKGFSIAGSKIIEESMITGDGVGKLLGLMNSNAKISVAKESGQAADTLVWENIVKMYNRTLGKKGQYVWLMHPDVAEQLAFLSFPVGTGGVPVYLPASSVGMTSLLGLPIYESEYCSAVGDEGDFMLVNLQDYLMIYKGGMAKDSSIHVQFLTDENIWRFRFRINGMPKRTSAFSIKNSSQKRSTIITLAARA